LHFAPHRHVQRHLALRHEHAPVHLQTDGLTQFNPRAGAIGAITIDHLATGAFDVSQNRGGCCDQENNGYQVFHAGILAQAPPLDQSLMMSHTAGMVPEERLYQITQRFQFLEAAMADGAAGGDIATLAKEYSDLRPVVEQIAAWRRLVADLDDAKEMLADPDMKELAEEELPRLKEALPVAEHALQLSLLPRDVADTKPAMLEIRPGTGGDEAALFAGDLLRMYLRYAESQGWKVEIIEQQNSELGGIKEVVAHIKGENVFARMKFESGVHRVQRVPTTESGGRIHTSAATVAVLPEAEDVDIKIDANDLRIDTMRASGDRKSVV